MGRRQFITLRTSKSNEETDMEVPSDRPISEILPEIIKTLSWPVLDENGNSLNYVLTDDAHVPILPEKTFPEAHVDNFEIVHVILDETQQKRILDDQKSAPAERIPGSNLTRKTENEEKSALSQPVPFLPQIIGPCLLGSSGIMFMIGDLPALIGRKSNNIIPQIDLTDLDTGLRSSRAHAEIIRIDGKYAIHVLKPKNGMLLNGTQLAAGSNALIHDGDVLQFGFQGVQLTWREPRS